MAHALQCFCNVYPFYPPPFCNFLSLDFTDRVLLYETECLCLGIDVIDVEYVIQDCAHIDNLLSTVLIHRCCDFERGKMKISMLKSIFLNKKSIVFLTEKRLKKCFFKNYDFEVNFFTKKMKQAFLDPSHQSASGNVNFQHFCLVYVVKLSFLFQVNSNYKYQYRSKNLK